MAASHRRQVFGDLVRAHAGTMLGLARRLVPASEAQDLVQDALTRAWQAMGRFRGEAELSTWLYRILMNCAHDRHRARARRKRHHEANWREVEAQGAASPEAGPGARPDLAHLETRINAEIDRLPPRQRECLVLRVHAEFSYREIARVMGIRPGAVKSHLVQARRRIAERLQIDLPEAPGGEAPKVEKGASR